MAAAAALAIRLFYEGLAPLYRALVIYLVTDTVQQILVRTFMSNGDLVGWIYAVGQLLKAGLSVFIVLNLCRLALAGKPALARFGHQTIGYLFGLAAVISGLGVFLDIQAARGPEQRLRAFLTFERTMDSLVLVVLALTSLFLLWFPLKVRRNVALNIAGFVVYSFERWAGLLATNLWPNRRGQFSIAMLSVSFICLMLWLITLRRDGETMTTVIGHRWNAVEADHLRGQLDAINARLERFSRQ